jgi:outer membrane protein
MRLDARAAAFALALAASSLVAPRVARADGPGPRIIVVDVRRAVLDTEEGLRVQASLKRLFDVRQRDLSEFERQFQAKQAAVQQKVQNGTPQSQLAPQLEELQRDYLDLAARRDQYTNEMSAREQQLTAPIYARIIGLIRKLADEKGAALIVDKTAAPYFRADLEITDRAIQMYNSGVTAALPAGPGPAVPPMPLKPSAAPTLPGSAPVAPPPKRN